MNFFADRTTLRPELAVCLPPPRLSLSEWADAKFVLSAESAAEPGPWRTLPYQKGIMDAITDPDVEQVSLMKSARVGYTLMVSAAVGYYMDQAPAPVLLVQPTVEDAKGFSKETIAPMLRDCPALSKIVFEDMAEEVGPKDSGNTILHKKFPGGVLSMVGANSGAGFRRVSRKVVIFDEVDGYPPSAGSDGDQIKLGIKRSEYYWDRKILAGSTPLVAGVSRIEALFDSGDQRRFFVPCPQCGHFAPLVFSGTGGHVMTWPDGEPQKAFFTCASGSGCVIEHSDKRDMVTRGEWRATAPEKRLASGRLHVSFHIWSAYSFSPNASWGQIAEEFLDAKAKGVEALRTFVNTVLGETWKEKGDAPDWERIYDRREPYEIGQVQEGVRFLTAGVDVQKDRWVYEVTGWGDGKESWSVDTGVIPGDPSSEADWFKLDELLTRTYQKAGGQEFAITFMAVDSGFNTQAVYNWARRHIGRVIATKGQATARVVLGTPTPVDVTIRGKRITRGCKVWPVGTDLAKAELYGWLNQPAPEPGQPYPPGYCHFPEYEQEFFKQLTAEHLVSTLDRRGYVKREWQQLPNRQNHILDARVYSRAAAALAGLDRMIPASKTEPSSPPPPSSPPVRSPIADSRSQRIHVNKGWLSKRR